jgi:hypothetical protein
MRMFRATGFVLDTEKKIKQLFFYQKMGTELHPSSIRSSKKNTAAQLCSSTERDRN